MRKPPPATLRRPRRRRRVRLAPSASRQRRQPVLARPSKSRRWRAWPIRTAPLRRCRAISGRSSYPAPGSARSRASCAATGFTTGASTASPAARRPKRCAPISSTTACGRPAASIVKRLRASRGAGSASARPRRRHPAGRFRPQPTKAPPPGGAFLHDGFARGLRTVAKGDNRHRRAVILGRSTAPSGDRRVGGPAMNDAAAPQLVEYGCVDRIATLTLNRPEKLNAFNDDLVRHLAEALRRFDLDPEAEVAILCGAGRAFSSGADVHQRQLRRREEFLQHGGPQGWGANSADLFTRAVNWKPVIAAPHGYAMGLALGIVLECDLIVAAAGTKFQITETSRGLGGSRYWALLNFRGAGAFAAEMALTGRFFTAEEALAAGVINRVAAAGQHLAAARELAAQIVQNPPLSVRAAVRTRRWYMEVITREVAMQTAPLKLYLSEDFHDAARAFAEKRRPGPFKGR